MIGLAVLPGGPEIVPSRCDHQSPQRDAIDEGVIRRRRPQIARQLGLAPAQVLAAGDHYNDLPMLSAQFAGCLVAPDNAIPVVKEVVSRQGGYVSHQPCGHGVARGLEFYLEREKGQAL